MVRRREITPVTLHAPRRGTRGDVRSALSLGIIALSMLAACASATPAATPTPTPAATPTRPQGRRAPRDFLIVPGVRMGPVGLGESEVQLRRTVGAPDQTSVAPSGVKFLWYSGLGLSVYMYKDRVYKIATDSVLPNGRRYATPDGATFGMEKQDLVATLGDPLWTQLVTPLWEVDCYPDETEFKVWVGTGPGKHHVFFIAIGACDDTKP